MADRGSSKEYQGVAGAGPSPRLRNDRGIQWVEDSSEKQPPGLFPRSARGGRRGG